MTNKELEKRIEEQKDRQDRLDKLYKQMNKNLIDLCRSVDKLTDDVEKLKSENKPTIWSTEPVTLPKPHEFKVGDRVQFDVDGRKAIGEITSIDNGYAAVYEGCINGKTISLTFNMPLDELKPATDEPKCKFKVGDTVKFVHLGTEIVGTIGEYDKINKGYGVLLDDGGDLFCGEEDLQPYTEPRWTFTDDEKVILRNLPEEFKWIARDSNGQLCVYPEKPEKFDFSWSYDLKNGNKHYDITIAYVELFKHLFQSIKWEDTEACEFRKYL